MLCTKFNPSEVLGGGGGGGGGGDSSTKLQMNKIFYVIIPRKVWQYVIQWINIGIIPTFIMKTEHDAYPSLLAGLLGSLLVFVNTIPNKIDASWSTSYRFFRFGVYFSKFLDVYTCNIPILCGHRKEQPRLWGVHFITNRGTHQLIWTRITYSVCNKA